MKPKFRHKVVYFILRPFFLVYLYLAYGYQPKKYKLKGNYLIVSNHISMLDPFFLAASFNFPIYYVASNDIFAYKFISKIITYLVEPISKTKNEVDVATMKDILSMSKAKGTIGLFLSGNATYSGTEEYIDSPIAKLVRKLNVPLIIYNLKGLYGVAPRWGKGLRRGYSTGEVREILSVETISKLSDDELTNRIKQGLNVTAFDLETKLLNYQGKNRAHFLERALFVCPDCLALSSLKSEIHDFKCESCGYSVTYQPNLEFKLNKGKVSLKNVKQWYDFEKNFINQQDYLSLSPETLITSDSGIKLMLNVRNKRKDVLIDSGQIKLFNNRVEIMSNSVKIILSFDDILAMAVHAKNRLLIHTKQNYYQVIGNERRSALKYMFIYYAIKNRKEGVTNGFLGI